MMSPPNSFPKKGKYRWVIILLALFLPACAGGLPLISSRRTPTPPAWVIQFEVTVIYPTEVIKPTKTPEGVKGLSPTPSPIALVSETATPTSTPPSQPTATPSLTLSPVKTSQAGAATPTATLSLATSPLASDSTPESGVAPADATPSPQPSIPAEKIDGELTLVELPDKLSLRADVGRVEFKWVWEGKGCTSPSEGQGFELRIWPDQPGFGPLGAMDASQPETITCDSKSGTWSYEMSNLRGTEGVSAVGTGRFRWDVALVQLDPYTPLAMSQSRVFDLPPALTTPASTPTPSPPRVALPTGQEAGVISLIQPQDGFSLPENTGILEFKWRWSLSDACEWPPEGYGFELRIWPDQPDFGPLGAMGDARESQADIFCDPSSGLFGYLVTDLSKTPAVIQAGAGRFRWDVVLIKLDPYSLIILPESYIFELPGESKL